MKSSRLFSWNIHASAVILAFAFCHMSSAIALAGGDGGGGGQHSCQEYTDLAGSIVHEMDKIEISAPGTFHKIAVDLNRYDDVVHGDPQANVPPLTCKPVDQLDRDAWSYPGRDLTHLKWRSWDKLSEGDKIRLTIHELSVLTNYESDGQYYVSDDIMRVISASSSQMRFELEADDVIFNFDGSVTFIRPFEYVGSEKAYFAMETGRQHVFLVVIPIFSRPDDDGAAGGNTEGTCKALGLKYSVSYSLARSSVLPYLDADNQGHVLMRTSDTGAGFATDIIGNSFTTFHGHPYATLTCKP